MTRTEPPATTWVLPDPRHAADHDVVAVGADLEPGTILAGYRQGLFPMHLDHGRRIGWWSPDPRGVLRLDDLRVSRSLRRSARRFEIRVDTDFDGVVEGCADSGREHGWIRDEIKAAYRRLFELGWVHTVETFCDGDLVGGLYGVSIGGLFAGESMFQRRSDASKVALVTLVDLLGADGEERLLDVQWCTDHLRTLGATEMPRNDYLDLLTDRLDLPPPPAFN